MESSGSFPEAVLAPELAELVHRPGPFLSLYLNTEPEVAQAARRSRTRWRTLRRDLADEGVPGDVLDAIGGLVPTAHRHGECLAVVATPDGVWHVEHGPRVVPTDRAEWRPIPRLLPLLRWRQTQPPYVVVLTDRTGADLYAFRRGAPDRHREIQGDHDVVRKVSGGGWSQRRYQERAEDSWTQNAEQVALAVEKLVDEVEAELVVVAGDVRAVQLLRKALPERVEQLVHVVDWEPPSDGGGAIPDVVEALVADRVQAQTDAVLGRLAEELGRRDHAVEGLAATARAVARAQAAVLLVTEATDDRSLWFDSDPAILAMEEHELVDLGVEAPVRGDARAVLIRGALATSAGVRVLDVGAPHAPSDGVGALLRW